MMRIFDKDVEQLIGRTTPMGTEQYLKERFTNEGLREGLKKGERLGIKKNSEQTVKNLIEQLDLTDTQIAGIVEVPVEFVQKIRAKLKK